MLACMDKLQGRIAGMPRDAANLWARFRGLAFGLGVALARARNSLERRHASMVSLPDTMRQMLLAIGPAELGEGYKTQPLMPDARKLREVALTAHSMTEDMMAGLGNTFSGARQPLPYGTPLADAVLPW